MYSIVSNHWCIRWRHISDSTRNWLMINLVVLPLVLAGLLSNPEFVQCHLAKRVKIQGEMVCIYRGPNGTIGYHYPMFKFSECPKTYMCRYTPNAKKKVSVQDILDGLKDGFE